LAGVKRSIMFKRKATCALIVLTILLAVTFMSSPAAAANYKAIGVKTGVLNTYQYNSTSAPSNTKFTIFFQSVVLTNATIIGTLYNAGGVLVSSFTRSGNISLYTLITNQNLRSYVVAANLSVGDNVASGSPSKFNSSQDMLVAGTTRTVLDYNSNLTGARTDYYYDRLTGVLVKANINQGGTNWENVTMISTTAWSAPPTQEPTPTLLMAGIGVVGLIVGLAVGLVIGRRKKGK
jgi:hypothetical protein